MAPKTPPPADRRAVRRLVGVYNADGTARGELEYFINARLGRAHCALCDITHGLVRERREWREYRARLKVPFDTYHRDDQPNALRNTYRQLPIVAAETDNEYVILLDAQQLADCGGSLDAFIEAIERSLVRAKLTRA
jgi:hypothetical protein